MRGSRGAYCLRKVAVKFAKAVISDLSLEELIFKVYAKLCLVFPNCLYDVLLMPILTYAAVLCGAW